MDRGRGWVGTKRVRERDVVAVENARVRLVISACKTMECRRDSVAGIEKDGCQGMSWGYIYTLRCCEDQTLSTLPSQHRC